MRILVVEDDPIIAQLIETILQQHKYAIDIAVDGQMGLELSIAYEYDAILLDISLPKQDGVSVCQEIRSRGNTVPILLLTALDSPADRTRGLDAGADDYLGKPFDPEELLARIRAILRRSHQLSVPILTWGALQLDPVSASVTYTDRYVPVTPKEYALLELLLRNSKRVFSCNAILDHLWSYEETPGEEAIRTHVKGLRQKLKAAGAANDFIETVYGIGYRLKPLSVPTDASLLDSWEKFKGQIHEQAAVLERLSIRFLNQDLQSDWQSIGQNTAHSLAVSLRTFGFSLSSELARQIEKLLSGHQDLTAEQGQWLFSLVAALQQELNQPMSVADVQYLEPDTTIDILVVSADANLEQNIHTIVTEQKWRFQMVSSIDTARLQLQQHATRSILLAPAAATQTTELLQLLLESSKQAPPVPVIVLSDSTTLQLEMDQVGTCIQVPPTISNNDLRATIEQAINAVKSSQTHVLVVDDDLRVLAVLQTLLVPWGFKVTTLSDPQQFWEVLDQAQPDLLILDVEMPLVSGLELCQDIRNQPDWSQLPIICLTSHLDPSLIQQVFAIGADDFVTKPVVGPEIISRITNLMKSQQTQQLKSAERYRLNSAPAKTLIDDEIKFALTKIEHYLQSLQHDVADLKTPKSRKLLQNACDQVDKLHELLLADH
jgi:DNA-binding response OmpR family regulator